MADKKSIRIAYISENSTNECWQFMSELAAEDIEATVFFYDKDKQASVTNETIGNKLREQPENKANVIYIATDTLDEALRDADFVILSLSVGTLDEIINDIYLPERYGIVQATAESAGPGGVIRALRTIPVCVEVAEAVKKNCPDAWVINTGNPMNISLMALREGYPEIKAFGSTNETFAAAELVAEFVSKDSNLPRVHRKDIKTNLLGINGFCWFDEVTYQGQDVMPIYRKFNENFAANGFEYHTGEFKSNPKVSGNRVKFDMFLRYGVIAAADDRHIAEHCPPWYISTQKTAGNWKFGTLNANYLKRMRVENQAHSKKLMNGDSTLKIAPGKSDLINQMKALMGLKNVITNVDMVNDGQVANLPIGCIVQTNALFSNNSIKPVLSGKLPDEVLALTLRHISNQTTIMRAAKEKDLDIAFNAFLNDPLMTLNLDEATTLYTEMLTGIRSHLVYYLNN